MQFEDLKPILSLKKLECLALTHVLPFILQVSDVSALLASLQSLIELRLNHRPLSPGPPSLHISCLTTIASIRPSLQTLDLYMDTSATDILEQDPVVSFPSMKLLNLGASRVKERDTLTVAFYLSHIIPNGLVVFSPQQLPEEVNPPPPHWIKVTKLVNMFQKAMKHGEQKAMSRMAICNPGL
ncbi:hypothetical protein ONZ45_g13422 [Pleurotus djamor]|nr:hypothetical protein ONZ45_g13422 [Pleurotus djamor]